MVGLVIGLIRFGLEFSTSVPACGDYDSAQPPQWWHDIVGQIHYLHFGLILWAIAGCVTVAVSLMTPPPPPDSLHRWAGLSSLIGQPALMSHLLFQADLLVSPLNTSPVRSPWRG